MFLVNSFLPNQRLETDSSISTIKLAVKFFEMCSLILERRIVPPDDDLEYALVASVI